MNHMEVKVTTKTELVYVVSCGQYEDTLLMCVHTNETQAEACASIHNGYVSEYELDHSGVSEHLKDEEPIDSYKPPPQWALKCPNVIRVDDQENLSMEGDLAMKLYFATSWPTGERVPDLIRSLASNPNYTNEFEPFQINWRQDGSCSIHPVTLEEGDVPDLVVYFTNV